MAGEVSSAGIVIKYCPETTAGPRPTTGYKQKATSATLNIADYVTGISGLGAEYDMLDITPLSETVRHRFIRGLMSNDGNLSLNANINPTSRADWTAIVTEFGTLTGGKSMWWEFTLPGDSQSVFFRGEPCPVNFPDVEAASAVQGTLQIVENQYDGWQTAST